jgi:predicted MFS family arabinose efflux permease
VTNDQEHAGRGSGGTPFNPFIVILWILAATLVAGGMWAFLNAASMPGAWAGDMALSFALLNYAPWAVMSGTLAAMTLLFWHAAQWQRRRA